MSFATYGAAPAAVTEPPAVGDGDAVTPAGPAPAPAAGVPAGVAEVPSAHTAGSAEGPHPVSPAAAAARPAPNTLRRVTDTAKIVPRRTAPTKGRRGNDGEAP
ncbi:hypothetical protein GCM10023263_37580 [Phytohabitans rumicis]